ncbi:nephrocystin-4 isoform X2 [Paramisgurnus dabryanus]|uniref:nephrocystin-4 isoform X2 n=1 Tax=Paramisgurnus dabryanus TaxID=90735 RepID=UPI0031F38C04
MSEWKEVFDRNRVIPPHSQTARQAQVSSHGLKLHFKQIDGLHVKQSEEQHALRCQLRVTLYDSGHQHFFGRTWKSGSHSVSGTAGQIGRVPFNEVVYFHTSLCLSSVVAVVELVFLSTRPDGSQNAVGSGFGLLQLFTGHVDTIISQGEGRLSLFNGTPRALLHPALKDPLQMNAMLSVMEGCQLLYKIQPHPTLTPIMHLLPPNILVSGHDSIPGVAPPVDGTDALRKPRLLKSFSCVLEGVRVALFPSVEVFESDLLQLLNRDCQNTNRGAEGRSVVVQERRLLVGVHNGWGWVEKPQVLVLEREAVGSRAAGARGAGAGDSIRQTSMEKINDRLSLRGSVALKMMRHSAFSIVFQLQYVFSCPMAGDGQMTSTAVHRAAFMQCVCWCVWSLFSNPEGPSDNVCLKLQSGALPNPWGVMVYSSNTQQVNSGKCVIKFKFSSGVETSANVVSPVSPRETSPTKKLVSASQDENILVPTASTLQSPRGPTLSLSQLAATSRYPTMSHTVGSPWQQQLPSLLSPSLMASAHQLSHVERPGAGSIAHLELSVQEREGERSEEEGEIQELTFNPVHAPVITLGTHAAGSSRSTSRRSLAQLFSSGFPQILDQQNQVAEVLDPSEPVNFDPQREEADPLQANTLILQFLAFTRVPQAGVHSNWPNSVHFTFQLYRFPPVTTERLKLLDPERSSRIDVKSPSDSPCVLYLINKDGSLSSGCPGLQLQYRVDPLFLKPGERAWFLRYLALHSLQIDVWDSESLLLIGSAAVELKHMLRQGRAAVQVCHELEVITTEYQQDASFAIGHDSKHRAFPAINVYTTVKGILHLRLGNVGCRVSSSQSSLALPPACSHVVQPSDATQGLAGGVVPALTVLRLNASNARRARRLPETDSELARLLQSTMREVGGAMLHKQDESEEVRQRKMDRMAAVRQHEEQRVTPPFQDNANLTKHRAERMQHSRDLHLIEAYRERCKAQEITNMLSQAITTKHTLYATLGTAEFFEFVLKNPLNVPQTITIECDDPELSVIVKSEEWRYFKELTKTRTPLEHEMFHQESTLTPQVYLRPKESLHIPFKYQSFLCGHIHPSQDTKGLMISKSPQMAQKHLSNTIQAKSIKVQFRGEDGKPLAICQVNVEPTPHVVDQTFRFYHPELTFLKKAIRLPAAWDSTADGSTTLHVRCSDPNVICHATNLSPGEPQDVYLKVPGCPSPQIRKFFITIFTDLWLASPAQIWQVYVHYLQRMDLSCVCGTLSWHSLVVHGTQAIRRVKCYTSHPLELQVDPGEVFALPAQGVQDVRVGVKALRPGSRFFYLNVLDVDTRQLVGSWLLCITCRQPVISKAFEIKVPVDGGKGSNKKISFTNPYSTSRVFTLSTDHPDLLMFKEEQFQIMGGEIYTIGLRFAPTQNPGTEEILIFINDQQDKNEDTYCVRVQYR